MPSQTFYYYNASGTWLSVTLSPLSSLGKCNAVLDVVAPTQLIVTGALTVNQPDSKAIPQLRLASSPTNSTLRPYKPNLLKNSNFPAHANPLNSRSISAGSWDITGAFYGIGDLYGDIITTSVLLTATHIYPGGVLPAEAQQVGTLNIHGNLLLALGTPTVVVDYTTGTYSVIAVSGTLNTSSVLVWAYGNVTNATYPVLTFNQTGYSDLQFNQARSPGYLNSI
mgnify:CR=1 FL=1